MPLEGRGGTGGTGTTIAVCKRFGINRCVVTAVYSEAASTGAASQPNAAGRHPNRMQSGGLNDAPSRPYATSLHHPA
ncbi:hypothetical protein [Paenibacillus chitinolyticus]|uniref:hypothetical protein n=1 Tax=Paenibacillus chitinolyticus TaxID=79263 RepID=UPI001C4684DC|nr:hypothetical protein [Paenibacillus chitinolyticus]MBV6713710.1 hypothetical protein [Paenibacillus chitinolyticus]